MLGKQLMFILRNAGHCIELGRINCTLPLVAGLAMESNESASQFTDRSISHSDV